MFRKVIWRCLKIAALHNIQLSLSEKPFRSKKSTSPLCLLSVSQMDSKPLLETQLLHASNSMAIAECQRIVAELILRDQWV